MSNEIFKEYREAKSNADMWKKEADKLGLEIKNLLIDNPVTEKDGFVFERKVSVRQKIDEESLMEWLNDNGYESALTTKMVIDEDRLTELLGEGTIGVEVLDKFTEKNEVVALYCKKAKKVKEV